MPRAEHLKALNQMVAAAYDDGTIKSSIVNTGGKNKEIQVSLTISQKSPHAKAFARLFVADSVPSI